MRTAVRAVLGRVGTRVRTLHENTVLELTILKSNALCPMRMAKKLNLQSRAEAETFSFADIDKPWGAGGECFYIDPLRHEEDLV